jgi:hypothetical protein
MATSIVIRLFLSYRSGYRRRSKNGAEKRYENNDPKQLIVIHGLIICFQNYLLITNCNKSLHIMYTRPSCGTIANDIVNEMQGQSSTMATSFIHGEQANATMSLFASDMYESSLNISPLSSKVDLLVFSLELNKMSHCPNLLESYTSMNNIHFGHFNSSLS